MLHGERLRYVVLESEVISTVFADMTSVVLVVVPVESCPMDDHVTAVSVPPLSGRKYPYNRKYPHKSRVTSGAKLLPLTDKRNVPHFSLRCRLILMIEDNIRRKIDILITRSTMLAPPGSYLPRDTTHVAQCSGCITEALNVIGLAIPSPRNAYRDRIEKAAVPGNVVQSVATIAEILRALLPDIDAGLLGDLGNKIRAETFDDFLDYAESYLKKSLKMESGVIAGVVFEDTIRRIYRDKITDDDKGKQVEDLINALARQNVITGQQSKQAKVAAHVRAKATHALWDEFDLAGVESTIQITKLFLREHFGG
jgi:hypothetical protein